MKKIIRAMLFTAMISGISGMLFSCKESKDEPQKPISNEVGPRNVFTGERPKSVAGLVIKTNEKGQVESLSNDEQTATFVYKKAETRSSDNTPDVIMTVITREFGHEWKEVYNFYLGENKFIKNCVYIQYNSDGEKEESKWKIDYNKDGQITKINRHIEGSHDRLFNIEYNNGDIAKVDEIDAEEQDTDVDTYRIRYTTNSITTPIDNKGCLGFYNQLKIDIDHMELAYYAGLLGRPTRHLPLQVVDDDNDIEEFIWDINEKGYPISFKRMVEGSEKDRSNFIWGDSQNPSNKRGQA